MLILTLVRNYLPAHQWVLKKGWHIADCASRSYDLEGMSVGIVGSGRIGLANFTSFTSFAVKLHYTDRYRLQQTVENELNLTYHADINSW